MNFASARVGFLVCYAALIGMLAFAVLGSTALSKERLTMKDGVAKCKAWCDANNKTLSSQSTCHAKCEKYWLCNGSDSNAETCKAAAAIEVPVVAIQMPTPVLRYLGWEDYIVAGIPWVRYKLSVVNRANFSAELFAPAPTLPPCGSNANAARAWVDIHDGTNGQRLYGFCALGSNADLDKLWFAVQKGKLTPGLAFIKMRDRLTNQVVTSNAVRIFSQSGPTGVRPGVNSPVSPN